MRADRRGFTLSESLIVVALVTLLLGAVLLVIMQFNRGYTKNEGAVVAQTEVALLLEVLRRDMVNAAAPPEFVGPRWREAMQAAGGVLKYNVHTDDSTAVVPVEWRREGDRLIRSVAGVRRVLLDGEIASLTLGVGCGEVGPPMLRKIWLEIGVSFRGPRRIGSPPGAPITVVTRMFPRRLIRQVNGGDAAAGSH